MFRNDCINTIDPKQGQAFAAITWKSWLRAGITLFVADFKALMGLLVTWQRRASSRRMLAGMDNRQLRDMGLTREQAHQESSRPFWRG